MKKIEKKIYENFIKFWNKFSRRIEKISKKAFCRQLAKVSCV